MTDTDCVAYQYRPPLLLWAPTSKRISSLRVLTKLERGSADVFKEQLAHVSAVKEDVHCFGFFVVSLLLSVSFQSVLGSSWLDGESIEWKLYFCNPKRQLFHSHKS